MRSLHATTVWIFERLGLDLALAGDLLEERASGRSRIWYLRQALIAIWIGTGSVLFNHKVLALRAVATGCAVNSVWLFLWLRYLRIGFPATPMAPIESIASLLTILFTQTTTGWVIARTHRTYAIPMVAAFTLWLSLWYVGDNFSDLAKRLVDSIEQPGHHLDLAWYLLPELTVSTGLLLGGIIGARDRHRFLPTNAGPATTGDGAAPHGSADGAH